MKNDKNIINILYVSEFFARIKFLLFILFIQLQLTGTTYQSIQARNLAIISDFQSLIWGWLNKYQPNK